MKNSWVQWICRLVAAILLLQTLYFKFTAAPESVELFTKLGMEPWGRILTGLLELAAGILLLWPAYTRFGALLGAGLMAGAIFFHLTILGIVVNGDALLFSYACLVFIACLVLIWGERNKLLRRKI
ncbi:DoxX family protein [Flavihumibacter sp. CACIAM 22H1]|uniref:DoxX family protein n=1 Tax=Flavihumibacter sp. CACIAM 22H1 TaxID=1812911 RepID=UPI0007A8EE4E|nr:DoxX family protein [Flavihumibacter sp. CACIAM 22H1]KYP13697.1 MAG: DoxX family protein [Flavihumibacter sp. CACIAM 22H1]